MTPIFQTRMSRPLTTSAVTPDDRYPWERGFTLLEVIITVGIMVSLVAFVAPKLGGRNQQIKAVVRKIGVLSRDIRNQSKLQNATYRLVIDMNSQNENGPNGKAEPKYSYWVEKAAGSVIGDQAEEEEKAKKKAKDDKDAAPPPDSFSVDSRLMKKPEELPAGMKFDRVELASSKDAFTEGRAYIYYLPQGYVEESIIQLSYGDKIKWTVAIRPLTGRADVYQDHFGLKDVRPQ